MTMAMTIAPQAETVDRNTLAKVLLTGDLEKLTDEQRMSLVMKVCETLGLNPMTQPFAFLKLSGKLVMYAKKDATEQLRKLHGVSIESITSQRVDDVFVVTATARDRTGRTDAATGAVALGTLKGEALANALMKAETKAKRRVTLSICGLGMLDETETDTLPREPQYTVEAPKSLAAPPEGAYRIAMVTPQRKGNFEWSDVAYIDCHGEERIAVAKGAQLIALLEQLAQNNVLCDITVTTNSKGKSEIEAVQRFEKPAPPVVPDVLPEDGVM